MLVSDAIDRTFSRWLYPGGESRPATGRLVAALDASATTFAITGDQISNVPNDSIGEIDNELIRVHDSSGNTVMDAERGFLGSTAATHVINSFVTLDPTYARIDLFDSLVTVIGQLYPQGMYVRSFDTTTTFSSVTVRDLPAGGLDVLSIMVRRPGPEQWYPLVEGSHYKVLRAFVPPKYELRWGSHESGVMRVVYAKDFTLPTSFSDDLLTVCGVPITLQPYLPMAIAGDILQGKEVPHVIREEIRRLLALEGLPVGSILNVGQALIGVFERKYVAREVDRLKRQDPIRFALVP